MTAEILEWMNHTLVPIEGAVFRHFRGIIKLIRQVDLAEQGRQPMYAALSAIRAYNRKNKTAITYEEVRDRVSSQVFLPEADWAVYTDDLRASNSIISGRHNDILDALEDADPDISWILLWLPEKDILIVYRSPYVGFCGEFKDTSEYADGGSKGRLEAPILPPEIVASMGRFDPAEILNPQTQSWSRA
jgi:hypothetical protein